MYQSKDLEKNLNCSGHYRRLCPQTNERQQRKPVINGIKEKRQKGRRSSEYPDTKIWWIKSQYLHIGWSEACPNVLGKPDKADSEEFETHLLVHLLSIIQNW